VVRGGECSEEPWCYPRASPQEVKADNSRTAPRKFLIREAIQWRGALGRQGSCQSDCWVTGPSPLDTWEALGGARIKVSGEWHPMSAEGPGESNREPRNRGPINPSEESDIPRPHANVPQKAGRESQTENPETGDPGTLLKRRRPRLPRPRANIPQNRDWTTIGGRSVSKRD